MGHAVGGVHPVVGMSPKHMFLKVWTALRCCLVKWLKVRSLATSLFHRTVQVMLSGTHLGKDQVEFTS